jgi:hypothetical protein
MILLAYFQSQGMTTLERNTWQRDAGLMQALKALPQ